MTITKDPNAPLRLCVVQLDGLPRAFTTRHNLWIPGEPLVDLLDTSGDSERLPSFSTGLLFSPEAQQVHRDIENQAIKAARDHLHEILNFLNTHKVDVAVFPEYLTPAECLPDLISFSHGRAVVAGLEHVRNRTVAKNLAAKSVNIKQPDKLLQRNVSVLINDERVRLITKEHRSRGEVAKVGDGPIVERVTLRNQEFRVGVAVCLDHLRLEEEFRKQRADIVCISAYSPTPKPFRPDEPRDYARLFANCALYGGSQIMVPDLQGSLIAKLGTKPIAPGFEAIVIVEYDGQPQRPSGLRPPNNRLCLRAEIIERTERNHGALTAIENLLDLPEETESGTASLAERLTHWLNNIHNEGPLVEALEAYRNALARDVEDPRDRELAMNLLAVTAGRRSASVRHAQAKYVLQRLKDGDGLASNVSVGAAMDAYRNLMSQLSAPINAQRGQDEPMSAAAVTGALPAGDSPGAVASGTDATPSSAAGTSVGTDPDQPGQVVDIRPYRACESLAFAATRLLEGVQGLTTASPKDDRSGMTQRCRYRAAEVAEWLTELTDLTRQRRDYEWNNAIGAATRHLSTLRQELRLDTSGTTRSSLVNTAQNLHDATIQLRELMW